MTIPGSRIYGNMNDETPLLGNEDLHTPEDVQSVTQDLLNRRDGMMESTTHSSLDNVSIHAANVVDGFEVTGKATLSDGGMLSTSILQATAETTVNENGILYNSFVDGGVNGRGGEIVNVTATGHIDTGQAKTAANLRNDTETVNDYITTDVWKYQLNEKSEDIDAGNLTDISAYTAYAGHSRDLAGNPRTLNNRPDNGCFETWNIPAGQAWQTAEAGKHYPVNGSVVYLHEGADLVLGQSAAFRPGYLLLRKDASLYGNGSTVQVPYVGGDFRRMEHDGTALRPDARRHRHAGLQRGKPARAHSARRIRQYGDLRRTGARRIPQPILCGQLTVLESRHCLRQRTGIRTENRTDRHLPFHRRPRKHQHVRI